MLQNKPILSALPLITIGAVAAIVNLQETATASRDADVILSADATERQLERLLARGAHAYLTKPADIAELLRVVDDALLAADRS